MSMPTSPSRSRATRLRAMLLLALILMSVMPVRPAMALASGELQVLDQALLLPEDVAQTPRRISLPWDWRSSNSGGDHGLASLEIRFGFDGNPDEPQGLYFARIGNRAEIHLNGLLLARHGRLHDANGSDYAKAPRFIAIPPGLLRAENILRITISADSGRHAGLSAITFGPASVVRNRIYASAYVWRILVGSVTLMGLCVLVGGVALLLWRTQFANASIGRAGRRDHFYGYATLIGLCWAIHLIDDCIQFPPLPWPWWGLLMLLARNGALYGMLMLGWVMAAQSQSMPPGRAGLPNPHVAGLLALSVATAALAWHSGRWELMIGWHAIESAWLLLLSGWHLRAAFRPGGRAPYRWLALSIAVNAMAVTSDWITSWLLARPSSAHAMPWAILFQILVMCALVVARFNAAARQKQRLLELLSRRIRKREKKLRQTHERLEQAAREQARALERTHIMRDMHDGVGMHIASAIRQLAGSTANQAQVLQTLRDSLDQLKLLIDVVNLAPGDLTGLLSSLRYRLEPRLEAAGLALEWDVCEIEPLPELDAERMRQLQYIVYAVIANVLQHAHASLLRITAHEDDHVVTVCIVDDGIGIAHERLQGQDRPLGRSMRARAREHGWDIEIGTRPPPKHGTGVRITLLRPRA